MGYTYPNGSAIGGPVIGRGSYVPCGLTYLDPETGQGFPALKWTFGAQGVKIKLDPDTGEIEVLKVASAFDIGKTINPLLVMGQVYGGDAPIVEHRVDGGLRLQRSRSDAQ